MFRGINTGFDIMASIDTKICYGAAGRTEVLIHLLHCDPIDLA